MRARGLGDVYKRQALALLFFVAQPAAAQLSFKPPAEAVHEDKLLNALKEGDKITGRVTIPDAMSASLIQPAGRDWRDFQRSPLPVPYTHLTLPTSDLG